MVCCLLSWTFSLLSLYYYYMHHCFAKKHFNGHLSLGRYSICWNKSGLHEVILGTTGRKQGTSSKAACLPSTESLLSKRRLVEAFMSLEHPLVTKFQSGELPYRAMKVEAHEYHHTLELLRKAPFFSCWRAKPASLDSFAVSR